MSWVKIDDQFFAHPKILAAGKDGQVLFIAGLCYSAAYLTDGVIPKAALPVIAASAHVRGAKSASRLVEVELWHESDRGWEIHDYHDHQPTAEAELKKRADRAEAGRKGGLRSRPGVKQTGSKPEANGEANQKRNGTPSPSPSPYSSSSPPQHSPGDPPDMAGAGAPTEEDLSPNDRAEAAVAHMALCDEILARADGTTIRNRTAWLKAAETNRRSEHLADLTRLATDQPHLDGDELAERIDPRCGPLDGGAARSAAAWAKTQAEQAEATAKRQADQVRTAEADAAIDAMDDDERLHLEARAITIIGDNRMATNQTAIRFVMRGLILKEPTNR